MNSNTRTPVQELPYSAGLMSQSCWFIEFKKLVQLIAEGKSEEEIRQECLMNNLFGYAKEYRAKRVYGYLTSRAKMLDQPLIELFMSSDVQTQKLINGNGYEAVVEGDKILGVETHSLSRESAWEKAISIVRRRSPVPPSMYILSSDGFANSYKDEASFRATCIDYFNMVNEHGTAAIRANLPAWLTETSEMGCGDDITLLMAYAAEHEATDAGTTE